MYFNCREEGADLNCGQVMSAKLFGREGSLLCTVKDAGISERRKIYQSCFCRSAFEVKPQCKLSAFRTKLRGWY